MNRLAERLDGWAARVAGLEPCRRSGRLEGVGGPSLLATLPGARIGEMVTIGPGRRPAEVAGFGQGRVVLTALGSRDRLRAGMEVVACGRPVTIGWSDQLRGRVLDAAGRPIDGRPLPGSMVGRPLHAAAPPALERRPVEEPLVTGVRAIDGLACLGHGQRIGLFAGPGVGKSSLLAQIARGAEVDCSVLCLVGERGREVGEFVREGLGQDGLARAVVICATADAPAGLRARALPAAISVAEGFRAAGQRVLLLVDSLTRCARAMREVALASGEPPVRRGYPASVFDRLAALIERLGNDARGSISAVFTVLTEDRSGDDPLAEEVRGMLDGHIELAPALAQAGCFPAVDPLRSLSRLMGRLAPEPHQHAAAVFRRLWAAYENRKDFIAAGAYLPGSEPLVDLAQGLRAELVGFLSQPRRQLASADDSLARLLDIASRGEP